MNIYFAERKNRDGSALVRELLSYGFRELYGEDMPEIAKTDNGKPYFPGRPDVYFSLSHTDTHVMCVIGDTPVGCDIQTIRKVSDRVKKRVCGKENVTPEEFFRAWTARECIIKYYGMIKWDFPPICSREALWELCPECDFCFYAIDDCIAAACAYKNADPPQIFYVEI